MFNRNLMSASELEFLDNGDGELSRVLVTRYIVNPNRLKDNYLQQCVSKIVHALSSVFQDISVELKYEPHKDSNYVVVLEGPIHSVYNCLRLWSSGVFKSSGLDLEAMQKHVRS